jgi:serine/threonine protein kinase
VNNSTWEKAKSIFDEARRLSDSDRAKFLDERCSPDAALRAEVEKLLGSYDSGFLEENALGAAEALIEPELSAGQDIGRYRIRELIGSGGMGQVFLAEDTELHRPVAFKVLHNDVADDNERVRRFTQEARAASALNHPNILTIHEIGSFDGSRYIVSEYVDGETLRERMQSGVTASESVEITCQIAAALEAAHSAGIIHRDIKPENVMIRRDGLVKVLDFGLAKLTEADDRPIDPGVLQTTSRFQTSPGLVMGTVAYMSPEQARGQAVDARTDLWSLGVVFHEMLTGNSVFGGESPSELIASILSSSITPTDIESLPSELSPICQKALSKDRDKRYQSAHDLLIDLRGEKKRMEYAIDSKKYVTVSSSDEKKTQVIGPRRTLSAEYIVRQVTRHKYLTISAVLLVTSVALAFTAYRYDAATPPSQKSPLSAIDASTTERDLKFSKLPISGQVRDAVISPDGKYVAYMPGLPAKGIRLLELETAVETEISSEGDNWWLTFSPDSKFVYYAFGTDQNSTAGIKRLSIRGGSAVKVVDNPLEGVSFSPDGATLVFTRELPDGTAILLANLDGSNERMIAKTQTIVNNPVFSPDGKTLACQMQFKEGSDTYLKVVGVSVVDGRQQALSDKKWNQAWSAVWLSNGNLIINAREKVSDPPQLWSMPPGGEPRALTSGLISYHGISATRNGDVLLTQQQKGSSDLWILPGNDANKAIPVTTTDEIQGRFVWTPDERIVLGSNITGNADIWIMNADGGGRKQLTNDPGEDVQPAVSPDGKYIAFTSNRAEGLNHLFLMDIGGGNLKQLTAGDGEILSSFSPDGKWIYFMNARNPRKEVRKIPVNGGESTLVATAPEDWVLNGIDVNRVDGRLLYGLERSSDSRLNKVGILSVKGNARLIDLPPNLRSTRPRWAPDNRSIALISSKASGGLFSDIWTMPIDGGGKPKQLTNFRTPGTYGFSWTANGRKLLVSRGTLISYPVLIRNAGQ